VPVDVPTDIASVEALLAESKDGSSS